MREKFLLLIYWVRKSARPYYILPATSAVTSFSITFIPTTCSCAAHLDLLIFLISFSGNSLQRYFSVKKLRHLSEIHKYIVGTLIKKEVGLIKKRSKRNKEGKKKAIVIDKMVQVTVRCPSPAELDFSACSTNVFQGFCLYCLFCICACPSSAARQ